MGKIFGISDLPASTIMTPFEPIVIAPKQTSSGRNIIKKSKKNGIVEDKFISQNVIKSNPVIKMRNGFGKLMKHFSKSIK